MQLKNISTFTYSSNIHTDKINSFFEFVWIKLSKSLFSNVWIHRQNLSWMSLHFNSENVHLASISNWFSLQSRNSKLNLLFKRFENITQTEKKRKVFEVPKELFEISLFRWPDLLIQFDQIKYYSFSMLKYVV